MEMNKNTHEDEGHDSIETIVHEEKNGSAKNNETTPQKTD